MTSVAGLALLLPVIFVGSLFAAGAFAAMPTHASAHTDGLRAPAPVPAPAPIPSTGLATGLVQSCVLRASVQISSPFLTVGQQLIIHTQALASGPGCAASSNYSYVGLPPGCVSQNVPVLQCFPQAPGAFQVLVIVTNGALATHAMAVVLVQPA
jgi:hypothetical protein